MADFEGWLLLPPERVPEEWRTRARPASLVPLFSGEVDKILRREHLTPDIDAEEEYLFNLAAEGLSTNAIAGLLHVTPRTVRRRLARLKERLDIEPSADLASTPSDRGR